ncbi:MAG: cyclic nucleotide-binding domain-containing protein [Pseudomonadota bacterium]
MQRSCGFSSSTPNFCTICDVRDKSICAELTPEEMKAVSQTMAHLPVKEAQTLIEEGEGSEYLYLVVSGSFRLVRMLEDGRRQIVGFAFPGDYLGMGQVAANDYTAEALEPSLVCRFSNGFLEEMGERHGGVKDRLISKGRTELHKAQDHIVILGKQNAEERVLTFLKMLRQQFNSDEIYLSMSRQDMADYLGLRLETLSRTLTKLKKSGDISRIDGRLVEIKPASAANG